MKILTLKTATTTDGLGDAPADALFAHTTVGAFVDAACMAHGFARAEGPQDVGPEELALVITDQVFLTSTVVGDFLRAAQGRAGIQQLALRKTPAVEYGLPLTGLTAEPLNDDEKSAATGRLSVAERAATHKVRYPVFLCRGRELPAQPSVQALETNATVCVVGKRELVTEVRLPLLPLQGTENPRVPFPFTSSVVAVVKHWVHVLWLNQLAPGILTNLAWRQNPLGTALRALSAFSFRRDRIMQKVSVIHPTARVHPTAYVEGSIIGPGVVVGARASVRQSVVAQDAEVGDHATVLGSVVGCRTYVTPRTYLVWCALYPDSVVGNHKMQVSLVGRHCHVNAWVALIDAKFQGAIKVDSSSGLQSTERNFLGSCVGHRSQLASKVLIHPGRVIPPDTVLVMRPDEVISTIPDVVPAGVPMVRDQGTLVPLASLKGKARDA